MSLGTLVKTRRLFDVLLPLLVWLVLAGQRDSDGLGRLIEWTIACAAAVAIIAIVIQSIRKGEMTTSGDWGRVLLILLGAFLGTWLTKWVQVTMEGAFQPTLWGNAVFAWFRKFDDVSFWTMLVGVIVCFFAALYLRAISVTVKWVRQDWPWISMWLLFASIAVAAYFYAVGVHDPNNTGTFFWRSGSKGPSTEVTKVVQIVEGVFVVAFIVIAHFVLVAYLKALWAFFRLPGVEHGTSRRGRFARYGLVPTMYAVLIAVMSATFLGNKLELFDRGLVAHDGTKHVVLGHFSELWKANGYPGEFGNKAHYNRKNVLILSALVWWPFAGPLVVWCIGLWVSSRRRQPPGGSRPVVAGPAAPAP